MRLRPAARPLLVGTLALMGGLLFATCFGGAVAPVHRALLALALWSALFWASSRLRPGAAFLLAMAFGLGWFGWGLAWTAESMIAHGRVPVPLAALGVVLLGALCAAFSSAALSLANRWASGPVRAVLAAALLVPAEWLRGPGLADFGWLTPAYALLDTPWAGWAPLAGADGVGAAFLLSAGSLAAGLRWLTERNVPRAAAAWSAALLLVLGGWGASQIAWFERTAPVSYRMVQPNLPVVDLFSRVDPTERVESVRALLRETPSSGAPVLTPEGILPAAWERLPADTRAAWTALLAEAASPVLHTNFRPTPEGWANSAFWQTPEGGLVVNDKRKLVPFGEYVPAGFRWFTDLLGIPMADLAVGSPTQPNPSWEERCYGILICYENLDGTVLRALARQGVPDVLLITSNLGWFGERVQGQHLDMSRMRALEAARPILSVNMNGTSAAVSASGRVDAVLPVGVAGVLAGEVEGAEGRATPYLRWGSTPALLSAVLLGGLIIGFALAAKRRRAREGASSAGL